MPEGDTVFAAAHRLHAALAGQVVARSDFRVPSLATVDLSGARVEGVRAAGKHLFIELSGDGDRRVFIHSHLKMEGIWHLYRPGDRWRRPAHTARIVLDASPPASASPSASHPPAEPAPTQDRPSRSPVQTVGFSLGVLELLDDPAPVIARLGPDPLSGTWDSELAAKNLRTRPDRPIGLALLDQRVLAGVGNVYRSELCFLLGVHPATEAGRADTDHTAVLTAKLLQANRLRTIRCTTGDLRRGRELWVYGRDRRPCRRCGTAIVRGRLGTGTHGNDADRVIYFCPRCQPPAT